ncbi:glycoside hydrolase family 3 C-terminal domain-containing protein [Eubacterium sp. MSJ-13]|uniref:glycoside hydrolase family 3 C-terminal domain-containing protein n=1 Tax=Eubacterium sp. MSJ-13 TaxID=2841513 RepID=UPI001C128B0B|nr:glycoside hydrolase family 3 C-terminal domain-containing protein [Eubacterium sp. MSJ-13]MBU5478157.1 glycoside hydrolase family 3 C-terminal domain-containing protein [Eubacterium sp. MSJ-13]
MKKINIDNLISEMTLEEKASLCSAADAWHTKKIDRLDLPSVMVSDGPHGLRKEDDSPAHFGLLDSIEAICFPTASALACSFDRELIENVGNALGKECQSEDISVLLGPGINMKRSPLCGRNFEYFSEDPYLAGEIGAAFVNGVQKNDIGTSLKHFAANNQEWRRMSISAEIDERTLNETYLTAFEKVVKQAKPWTIMCSYNQINGEYSCENKELLTDILRDKWGFDGLVMTDWGAMNDRVKALEAGLDLEMPSSHGETDKLIVKAVNDGSLDIEILNNAVRRILTLVDKALVSKDKHSDFKYDMEWHHELSQETAENCAVLLKNNGALPLSKNQNIAFIGEFADKPRIQGGGSSHINCHKIDTALNCVKSFADVTYAKGYNTDDDKTDKTLLSEAIDTAKNADIAVIFAGLPDAFENEGFDRKHIDMPKCQNELIEEICKVQKNVVVVLHNGSSITMPWIDKVNAVLEMYLAGEASGAAAVNLLFGMANPSGKLAESFPMCIEDTPAYLNFPGNRDKVNYNEGIFIGYRYYDKKKMNVLFPFGYGLSYTKFRYGNMKINSMDIAENEFSFNDNDTVNVSIDITNIGDVYGAEIVQLYIENHIDEDNRPVKELRDFAKVKLEPGETKTVNFTLNFRSWAYYNETIHDWYAPSGEYKILIAASSRDIKETKAVSITSTVKIPFAVNKSTTCEDVERFAKNKAPLDKMLMKCVKAQHKADSPKTEEEELKDLKCGFGGVPLHSTLSFTPDELKYEDIRQTIAAINESEE